MSGASCTSRCPPTLVLQPRQCTRLLGLAHPQIGGQPLITCGQTADIFRGVEHLAAGFASALQPLNLFLAFAGVFIGTSVGMIPGIGPINGIRLDRPYLFAITENSSKSILFMGKIMNPTLS